MSGERLILKAKPATPAAPAQSVEDQMLAALIRFRDEPQVSALDLAKAALSEASSEDGGVDPDAAWTYSTGSELRTDLKDLRRDLKRTPERQEQQWGSTNPQSEADNE